MSLKATEAFLLKQAKDFSAVQTACVELLKHLPAAEEVRRYADKRISSANQKLFNVGYFPDEENLHYLLEMVPRETLQSLGLIYPYHVQNGDHRTYIDKCSLGNHNMTIPYYDFYGNMIALVGRTTLSDEQRKIEGIQKYRYTNRFTKSLHLFGLYQAKHEIIKKRSVVLVEGQIDCITCHEYGIRNVVALGGSSLGKFQFNLVSMLAEHIDLALDGDVEGIKARKRIITRYSKDISMDIIAIPEQLKDIDSYLRSGGTIQERNYA